MYRRFVLAFCIFLLPIICAAQQKTATVGFLSIGNQIAPQILAKALEEFGYIEGKNIRFEYRFGAGNHAIMETLARELVEKGVDVILAGGDEAIAAAQAVTKTVPIVMFACDALGVGFIQSLAKPGGNTTGITCVTSDLASKRIGIIREIVPSLRRLAIIYNPVNKSKPLDFGYVRDAAVALGIEVTELPTPELPDIERAFTFLDANPHEAIVVLDESWILLHARRIAELTLARKLPDLRSFREGANSGGLVSYGPSAREMLTSAAKFIPKILAGVAPADLPVEQPTRFELIVNQARARALGITVPQTLLVTADHVIE